MTVYTIMSQHYYLWGSETPLEYKFIENQNQSDKTTSLQQQLTSLKHVIKSLQNSYPSHYVYSKLQGLIRYQVYTNVQFSQCLSVE